MCVFILSFTEKLLKSASSIITQKKLMLSLKISELNIYIYILYIYIYIYTVRA